MEGNTDGYNREANLTVQRKCGRGRSMEHLPMIPVQRKGMSVFSHTDNTYSYFTILSHTIIWNTYISVLENKFSVPLAAAHRLKLICNPFPLTQVCSCHKDFSLLIVTGLLTENVTKLILLLCESAEDVSRTPFWKILP